MSKADEWKRLNERNKRVQALRVRVRAEDRKPAIRAHREPIGKRQREDLNEGFRVKGGPTERVGKLPYEDRVAAIIPDRL